jgi:hypothetical protein
MNFMSKISLTANPAVKPMIVSGLSKSYGSGPNAVKVLDNLNLRVDSGEFIRRARARRHCCDAFPACSRPPPARSASAPRR